MRENDWCILDKYVEEKSIKWLSNPTRLEYTIHFNQQLIYVFCVQNKDKTWHVDTLVNELDNRLRFTNHLGGNVFKTRPVIYLPDTCGIDVHMHATEHMIHKIMNEYTSKLILS